MLTKSLGCWAAVLAAALTIPSFAIAGDAAIELRSVRVASGLTRPLFVTSPPNDDRLFIVEQGGFIRILQDGEVLQTPFFTPPADLRSGGELGLLGLAFHPNYAENGFFYVNFTEDAPFPSEAVTYVARYEVSDDPNVADESTRTNIINYSQPYTNHNGGMIAFGPNDGFLYIASGDGGLFNDPDGNGQDTGVLLGKMLRLDVDSGSPYAVPPSNPFAGAKGALGEIWAYGLRNPWRFSFDRQTGDMYIGDVGQGAFEEIDFQPASSMGGENYGWDIAEGFECLGGGGTCGTNEGFTPPIHVYGREDGQAITGGYVYRGSAIPALQGTYFFADYQSNRIWSFRYDGNTMTEFQERTSELMPAQGSFSGLSSFGEDADGELYITSISSGDVFRIARVPSIGDVNNDGSVDAVDIQLVINAALGLNVEEDTDLNNDETTDAVDVQLVINAALGVS